MSVRQTTILCSPAAGSSGSATATAISSEIINGLIVGIHVDYLDSPPATTVVTIAEAYNSPAMPILTLTNKNTDDWFQPLAAAEDTAGAAITNAGLVVGVMDRVKVTIAGANAGDGVKVTIRWAM